MRDTTVAKEIRRPIRLGKLPVINDQGKNLAKTLILI